MYRGERPNGSVWFASGEAFLFLGLSGELRTWFCDFGVIKSVYLCLHRVKCSTYIHAAFFFLEHSIHMRWTLRNNILAKAKLHVVRKEDTKHKHDTQVTELSLNIDD